MNEIPIAAFEQAIQATHRARSRYRWHERLGERFEVLVFELLDHPRASLCYAWEVDGEVTAVLGLPPVDSAWAAVRASIVVPSS